MKGKFQKGRLISNYVSSSVWHLLQPKMGSMTTGYHQFKSAYSVCMNKCDCNCLFWFQSIVWRLQSQEIMSVGTVTNSWLSAATYTAFSLFSLPASRTGVELICWHKNPHIWGSRALTLRDCWLKAVFFFYPLAEQGTSLTLGTWQRWWSFHWSQC